VSLFHTLSENRCILIRRYENTEQKFDFGCTFFTSYVIIASTKVQRTMKNLVNKGVIVNIGSHRRAYWKVNEMYS